MTGCDRPHRIRGRDCGVHKHAGIAVAGHHAGIARLALVGDAIEVENRAQWLAPSLAAPDVEVPVQIKVFVPTNAANRLRLASHKASNLGKRRPWVQYGKPFPQPADCVERSEQLIAVEIDQM